MLRKKFLFKKPFTVNYFSESEQLAEIKDEMFVFQKEML